MPHLWSRCYILCPFAIPLFPCRKKKLPDENPKWYHIWGLSLRSIHRREVTNQEAVNLVFRIFLPLSDLIMFSIDFKRLFKLYPFKQNYWVERERKKKEFSTPILCSVQNLRLRCFWTKYPRRLIDRKMWRNLYCIGHERFIGNRYLFYTAGTIQS